MTSSNAEQRNSPASVAPSSRRWVQLSIFTLLFQIVIFAGGLAVWRYVEDRKIIRERSLVASDCSKEVETILQGMKGRHVDTAVGSDLVTAIEKIGRLGKPGRIGTETTN